MKFLGKHVSPIIVAEISCNHAGSLDRAKMTIVKAYQSGADVVKIQTYTADEMCADKSYTIKGTKWDGQNLYELYKKNETPYEWLLELFDFARSAGIPLYSSVFSLKGLKALEKAGCPAYKIAGFESNDTNLILKVKDTNKPIVMSLNQFTTTEKRVGLANVYLYCISNYPTKINDLCFRRYLQLKEDFGYHYFGFSDHCESMHAAAHAAAMGADMIERHFSLELTGDDKEVSLNPAQFRLYVKGIRRAAEMYEGRGNIGLENAQFMRSIYATKDIKKGEIFNSENIGTFRPNEGIPAALYRNILGKYAKADISANKPLKWDDIL